MLTYILLRYLLAICTQCATEQGCHHSCHLKKSHHIYNVLNFSGKSIVDLSANKGMECALIGIKGVLLLPICDNNSKFVV